MKSQTITFLVFSTVAALSLGVSTASADDSTLQAHASERSGFTLGLGAGLGHLECTGTFCDGVTGASGLDLQAGLMITPRLAMYGDLWAMVHMQDRLTVSQSMATFGLRIWFVERLWLQAGLGVARASYNYDADVVEFMDSTNFVPASAAAVGVEILTGRRFALNVQLRAGTGYFRDGDTEVDSVSLGLGANWF